MIELHMGPVNSGKSRACEEILKLNMQSKKMVVDLRYVNIKQTLYRISQDLPRYIHLIVHIKEAWLFNIERFMFLSELFKSNNYCMLLLDGIDFLHNRKPTILETEIKYLVDRVVYHSALCKCGKEQTRYSRKLKGDMSIDIEHEPEDSDLLYEGVCPKCYDRACLEMKGLELECAGVR